MTSHIESWAADRGICSHGSQRCKCPVCECFAELSDLRAAVAHAAAQLGAAEAKTGDAPESARAHFREAVRTIARTLPPTEFAYDRTAVWGELREMDRLHAELAEAMYLLRMFFVTRDPVEVERVEAFLEKHKEKP